MVAFRGISKSFHQILSHSNPNYSTSQFLFSRGFSSKLFVKGTNGFAAGISFSSTEKSLAEAFSKFGQIVECMESTYYFNRKTHFFLGKIQNLLISWQFTFPAKIITDKASNRSKGYGYVTFATEDEAKKALMKMNGKLVDGRPVVVDNA